jgi:hypothetical protein
MPASLSRADMERVIKDGGSVLHRGILHTRVETLPTEADLAEGDPAREQAAREALDAQIAALTAQRSRLDQAQPGPNPPQRTARAGEQPSGAPPATDPGQPTDADFRVEDAPDANTQGDAAPPKK